jgi:hypothetical protein
MQFRHLRKEPNNPKTGTGTRLGRHTSIDVEGVAKIGSHLPKNWMEEKLVEGGECG